MAKNLEVMVEGRSVLIRQDGRNGTTIEITVKPDGGYRITVNRDNERGPTKVLESK